MTIKKIGNLLLDSSNLTAERSITQQDRDGALADLQNIQDIADKQSFKLNGTATSYAVSQTTSALAIGTGDCTVIWRGLLNNITGTRYFLNLYDGASGIFSILHYSGLISLHNGGQVASGFTAPTGKPFSVAMKRYTSSGGKFKTYLNGIADIERSATVTDFANSTYFSVGYISGANTIDGSVFRALFFNYALSDEKITRYSNGGPIDWEDLSGSMTAITAGTPTAGKRYRITSVAGGASFTASGASANTVGEAFIANGTSPTWGSGSLIQLGVCVAYEPENISESIWFDSSLNGLDGMISGAVAQKSTPYITYKNYLINGALDFWQRGTSTSATSAAQKYIIDRWFLLNASNVTTAVKTADHPINSTMFCALLTAPSASAVIDFRQRIESINAAGLVGKRYTFSFWAKRNAGDQTSFSVSFNVPTAVDNYTSSTTIKTVTFTNSATWQFYSITVPITTDIKNGLEVAISITSGSVASGMKYANLMLNEGPVAAQFERAGKSIEQELILCQRHFVVFDSTTNSSSQFAVGDWHSSTETLTTVMSLPVTMRTKPTLYAISAAGTFELTRSGASLALSSAPTLNQATPDFVSMDSAATAGGTAGSAGRLKSNGTGAYIMLEAEF